MSPLRNKTRNLLVGSAAALLTMGVIVVVVGGWWAIPGGVLIGVAVALVAAAGEEAE